MEGLDPTKLEPALIGPGGALVALLAFIGYLLREVSGYKKERDTYQQRYENMREQRDEFRFLAGDAIRAAKRSTATNMALARSKDEEEK